MFNLCLLIAYVFSLVYNKTKKQNKFISIYLIGKDVVYTKNKINSQLEF